MNYFNITEFDSPDQVGSGRVMKQSVLDMLDEARAKFDKAIHLSLIHISEPTRPY